MKSILVIFTGGTIGSIASQGEINTSKQQGYNLLNLFEQSYTNTKQLHFETRQPIQILSENIQPSIWEQLIKVIEQEDLSKFEGIIITHGTDTLAYTAAALSLYFNSITIPVLLVSSNHPLKHPHANGLIHFICAVEFIQQRQQAGVFVPYRNHNSETLIHLGSRLSSCLQLSGDFISVQSKAYLKFTEGQFYTLNNISSKNNKSYSLVANFSTRILLIKPYPGLDYSHFLLDKVDIVLHELYHSGTACSLQNIEENHSLLTLINQCQKKNIPIFISPAIKHKELYHSTQTLIQQGAQMLWNMSIEASYIKLLLAYSNFKSTTKITQFLNHNIASEIID